MNFPERLSYIMKERGLLQREAAAAMGITRQAFGRYLVGAAEPDSEKLQKLARFLNLSPSYLLFGEGEDEQDREVINIPVMNLGTTEPVRQISVKKDWIKYFSVDANENTLGVAVIVDENMTPTLRKGDMVFIDTSVNAITKEGIYIIEAYGTKFVKRAKNRLDGTLLLIDDNMHYGHETLTAEQAKSLKVLGKCMFSFKANEL